MCFGGGGSTTTETQESSIDPMIRQAGQAALNKSLSIGNQSYPGYAWQDRTAAFNPTQNNAFDLIKNFTSGNATPNYGFGVQGAQNFANAPAGNLSTERLVDQGGWLGNIGDYINPYISNALAPAIGDIQQAGAKQRIGIGNNATSAGAYGDARHGVTEGMQMRDEMRTIGDLSHQAHAAAFGQAMGQRAQDIGRYDQMGALNQQLREQQLQRQLQGGEAALGMDLARNQGTLSNYLAQLGIGDKQQEQTQKLADARYEEFLTAREWPFRQLDAQLAFLSGNPVSQTVTTTKPDQGIWGALGALGGTAAKMIP